MPWEDVRPGVRRTGVGHEHVTLVMNRIEAGTPPLPHTHADFMQIATIVSGHGLFQLGARDEVIGPGSVLIIPAGVEHCIRNIGTEPIFNLDVFAPERSDFAHLTKWLEELTPRRSPAP